MVKLNRPQCNTEIYHSSEENCAEREMVQYCPPPHFMAVFLSDQVYVAVSDFHLYSRFYDEMIPPISESLDLVFEVILLRTEFFQSSFFLVVNTVPRSVVVSV